MTVLTKSARFFTSLLFCFSAVAVVFCTGCPEAIPTLSPIDRDPNNGADDPVTDVGAQDRPDDLPSVPNPGTGSGNQSDDDSDDDTDDDTGDSSGGAVFDPSVFNPEGDSEIDRDVEEFGKAMEIDPEGHFAEFATGFFDRRSANPGVEDYIVESVCRLGVDNIGEVLFCEWHRPDTGSGGAEAFDIINRVGDNLFLEQDIFGIFSPVRIRRVNDDSIEFWRTVNTTGEELLIWTAERSEP
jgi:hypothetical protein